MSDTDNLDIKKRARRRLVGAAALALLAAIVLPMAMEQEPPGPSQDIQVSIPDRDAAGEKGRPIVGREEPEPQIAPAPVEQPPSPAPAAPAPSAVAPKPAPAPAATPAAPGASSKPATTAAEPAAGADEAARVRAILDGASPPAAAAPVAAEGFVLQIGAFSDGAKAGALGAELKKLGFAAYTEKAGTVTRVRVGPFRTRSEAESAAARLRAQGQNPVLAPR